MRAPGRFQPSRAGIVNLYQYDDQTFNFADGRLLLRGHNTSGKTKALELLLPFCLDGDISPRKLDPFAGNAKEMKWNLVGCTDDDQRIGYAWLELGRLSEHGLEVVTCGIGMKANSGVDGVRRWYFVAPGRRVGDDLRLLRGDHPLTRSELQEALGDEALIATAGDYRRRLNDEVFGFASLDQYRTMITLMLQLRRPHLSKTLDPRRVTELLSASLPEVDHDLMRRLGEGLEQLDELQAALAAAEETGARVRRFHGSAYRPYARAVIAERADALRAAETTHDSASADRRRREAELEAGRTETARIAASLLAARATRDEAEGEREALVSSAEWAAVAQIEQLAQTAAKAGLAAKLATERRDDAANRLSADEAELEVAVTAAGLARSRRAGAVGELAALAREARLPRHEALAAGLDDEGLDPERWVGLAHDEAERWLTTLAEHERLLGELVAAARRHEHRRDEEAAGSSRLHAAAEGRAAAESALESERERLAEMVESWAAELRELSLDVDQRALVLERALEAGVEGMERPQAAWAAAARRREGELLADAAKLDSAAETLRAERDGLQAERDRLAADGDDPPAPLPARPADRGGRPGAPLWALVDFRGGLDAAARAGIEAALEGAGLLDAWVTPDGHALDAETLDAAIVPAPRPAGKTLAEALIPSGDASVPAATVHALLESVALEGADEESATAAVAPDGRYRTGPLRGRFGRAEARYIGSSARAAQRARRLAELDVQLGELESRADAVARERATFDARLARLDREQEGFPATLAVERAHRALAAAEQRVSELEAELDELRAATRAAAERSGVARTACSEHAASAGLPADLDEPSLRALREAVQGYRHAVTAAARATADQRRARTRAAELKAHLEESRTAVAELGAAAEHESAEARRLAAEQRERERALGSSGLGLRERKRAAEKRAREARAELERLQRADKDAGVALRDRERDLEHASAKLDAAREHRERALDDFRGLASSGLFALGLGREGAPDGEQRPDRAAAALSGVDQPPGATHGWADAASWTFTRALEAARALPLDDLRADREIATLANRVERECAQLDRELAQRGDLSVVTQRAADGAIVVSVADGPRERTLDELMGTLEREVAQRHAALSAEQSRVFGDALLEDIADHLRRRVARVEDLVTDMNGALDGCPTGSGRTVQLEWRPRDDGPDGDTRALIRLLRRSMSTLGEEDRGQLAAFLRGQIERARQDASLDDAGDERISGHLRRAFDYRRWFAFDLIELHGAERARLTRKRHAVGSGGEQAVLVHLPLFAAAAALYDSSQDRRAPRLIMLDEALSGIDDSTRERVMHALVQLDLDVVMTSHELWGTYHTVPQLGIYQLHRDNDLFGVFCEPFLWDGELLREGEQAELV